MACPPRSSSSDVIEKGLALTLSPGPVARLQHGISQAVARHILTHKHDPSGGLHMDTLIRAVCGKEAGSMTLRNYRRRLKEDAGLLLEIGIEINNSYMVKRITTAR